MRKITLLLIGVLFINSNLNAQNDSKIKNSIKINGLALFSGFYEFQYERLITEKSSIKIGFGNGTLRNKSGSDADKDFQNAFGSNTYSFVEHKKHIVDGFTINADFRYYFSHLQAPKGLYISPGVQYLKLNEKYTYIDSENRFSTLVDDEYSIVNIRFLFGYQFVIAKRIVFNPYLG